MIKKRPFLFKIAKVVPKVSEFPCLFYKGITAKFKDSISGKIAVVSSIFVVSFIVSAGLFSCPEN